MSYNLFESSYLFFDFLFNYENQYTNLQNTHSFCLKLIVNKYQYNLIINNNRFKYPYYYNIINDSNFNQITIKNSTFDTSDELLDKIYNSQLKYLFSSINKIPNNKIDISNDLIVYNSLHSNDKQIYNLLQNIYSYNLESSSRNFYDILYLNNNHNINYQNNSFIIYYYLYSLITNYINNNVDYMSKLKKKTNTFDSYIHNISDNFLNTNNSQQFSKDFKDILNTFTYQFASSSIQFNNLIKNNILNNQIPLLKNSINTFFNNYAYNILLKLNDNIEKLLYGKCAYLLTQEAYQKRNSFLNFDKSTEKQIVFNHEFKILNEYLSKLSSIDFDNYMTILYYYRHNFDKFINLIPILSEHYITNNIKSNNDNSMYSQTFKNILNNFNIDNEKLKSHIDSIHDYDYISNILIDNDLLIYNFAQIVTFLEYIELYIRSKEFNNTIETILNNIYKYLRDLGYINDKIDWMTNKQYLVIYIHEFLNNQIFNNVFLQNLKLNYINVITTDLTNHTIDIDFDNNINVEKETINDFNYKQMWLFYENLITSTLTIHNVHKIHDMYKNF